MLHFIYLTYWQYNPWGRGFGNPPEFDRQGRMVKPVAQQRDAVRRPYYFIV